MRVYIQQGSIIDLTAPAGGFVSGTPVRIGAFYGVPQCTVAVGIKGAVKLDGVFELPKVSAQAWTEGQVIYSPAAGGLLTNVSASGLYAVGVATEPAANPSAVGRVRLDGAAVVAVP